MNAKGPASVYYLFLSGLFLIFDQSLKYFALQNFDSAHTYLGFFGWKPFLNPGVAFSLPVPQPIILLFTIPVLIFLACLILRAWNSKTAPPTHVLGLSLVFFGALSNLIDRLIFKHTVDYLLLYTGVFNVADLMIIAGFLLYLWISTKKRDAQNI